MVPVHDELDVLVKMEVMSIDSLNVTAMVVPIETDVVSSAGETELTDGAVVSSLLPVVNPVEVSYWEPIDAPELYLTSDVTRILYVGE